MQTTNYKIVHNYGINQNKLCHIINIKMRFRFSDLRSSMVSTLEPEDKKAKKEVTVPAINNSKCSTNQSNMLYELMVDNDDDDGIEMNENDFEEASVAGSTSVAQQMLSQADNPVGFSDGVTLLRQK